MTAGQRPARRAARLAGARCGRTGISRAAGRRKVTPS